MTIIRLEKKQVQLSPEHPSSFLSLTHERIELHTPVIINQDGILIDGYRRYRLTKRNELDAIRIDVANVFEAALELNCRTRIWDETDCLLWWRWANALGVSADKLPISEFPSEFRDCNRTMLELLADRKLGFKQFHAILKTAPAYRDFYLNLLAGPVKMNANETADFIEMTTALKKRTEKQPIHALFQSSPFKEILASEISPKQKGEALLKALRVLRYPYYQKKLEQFTTNWHLLNLGRGIQARKNTFIERGVLEILLSSSSLQEMKEDISKLSSSLNSPLWEKIWEE